MKFKIKEGIIITIIPLFGYLATYNFEVGYLKSFNLPNELAQIKIESLITFSVTITLFILTLVGTVDLLYPYYKNPDKNPLLHGIVRMTYIFLFGIFIIFYFNTPSQKQFLPIFIVLLFFSLIVYFLPLFLRGGGKKLSFFDRVKSLNESKQKQQEKSISILDKIPFKVEMSVFILSILVIAWLGQLAGEKVGTDAKRFISFDYKGDQYAVIRIYNDEKLAIKIRGNKLTDEYIFLQKESLKFQIIEVKR